MEEDRDGDIPAVSIPEIMKRYKLDHIDLLKIDIEGSGKNLFSHPNAASWLPSVRLILVELHDRFIPGCSEAVANALKDCRYHGILDEYDFYSSMLVAKPTALAFCGGVRGAPFALTAIEEKAYPQTLLEVFCVY